MSQTTTLPPITIAVGLCYHGGRAKTLCLLSSAEEFRHARKTEEEVGIDGIPYAVSSHASYDRFPRGWKLSVLISHYSASYYVP